MNIYIKEILKELCNRVNADFDEIDFKSDNWYKEYSWSEQEENNFKEWLINYLYNSKEAREATMKHPLKHKKYLKKFANMFALSFGWSYAKEELDEK